VPVTVSKEDLQGFLKPIANISGLAPETPTKGLSEGIAYGEELTSILSNFPITLDKSWDNKWPSAEPSPEAISTKGKSNIRNIIGDSIATL
jgi:hypothetical protein